MPWGRLDDSSIDHPKFAALFGAGGLTPLEALAAVGLWTRGLAYAAKHRTDGKLLLGALALLGPGMNRRSLEKLADALTNATGQAKHGLWEKTDYGYRIHDWAQWNITLEQDEYRRRVKAEAGRRGGVRSGQARAQASASSRASEFRSTREASAVAPASEAAKPEPEPDLNLKAFPLFEAPASAPSAPTLAPDVEPVDATGRPLGRSGDRVPQPTDEWLNGYQRGAFHWDCPERRWQGFCVDPTWPGATPHVKQCPAHRAPQGPPA